MKNKKLNYKIAFDGNIVSEAEQMRLWAELISTLQKLHNENKNIKDIDTQRDDRTF